MNSNQYGNKDEKEKNRRLSADEQKRLDEFEVLSNSMIQKGYKRVNLTVSIVKANIFAIILLIPLFIIGDGAFIAYNEDPAMEFGTIQLVVFIIMLFVLIVVHELIHGFTWSLFTEHGFKDIAFGFMKEYMTPYCYCKVPLKKSHYILGAVMPFLLLGMIPMIIGVLFNQWLVLLMGIIMADSAAGDLMIIVKLLRYTTDAKDVVYMDHPTQAGGVVFEK
jgi:hypothetical protein